jgi:hypothetical protein
MIHCVYGFWFYYMLVDLQIHGIFSHTRMFDFGVVFFFFTDYGFTANFAISD